LPEATIRALSASLNILFSSACSGSFADPFEDSCREGNISVKSVLGVFELPRREMRVEFCEFGITFRADHGSVDTPVVSRCKERENDSEAVARGKSSPLLSAHGARYRDGMKKANNGEDVRIRQDDRSSAVIAVVARKHAETERLLNGLLIAVETHIAAAKAELLQKCDGIERSVELIAQELARRSRDGP